jgi:hypothetical protein
MEQADDGDKYYPVETIARLLMLTPRRVQYLVKEGVIPKGERGKYGLVASVQGYIHYLQTKERQGARRLDEDARLRAAQADLRQFELQKQRGEVLRQEAVVAMHVDVAALYRQRVVSMGARLAGALEGRSESERKAIIDAEAISILETVETGLARLGERYASRAARGSAPKKKRA